ncbi:MAG: fused MFS/spermidine synthase [Fimbriimonadaceae bacterium]|nr:fused MFS/spermidine synthase [Chitinophagales bacterium]
MPAHKVTIWEKILSYFVDIKIETVYSEVNSSLDVVLVKGRFQLNSANATYSYEDLYNSYGSALKKISSFIAGSEDKKEKVQSVLVLGLGLGSIPYMLQIKYDVDCVINCVEIDPVVINLAEKYYPNKTGLHKLLVDEADAYDWVLKNEKKFDLITVDLFVDRNVPKKLHRKEFIEGLKKAVAENGIILFSRLKSNKDLEYILWDNLFEVFKGGEDIETMGNAIYYWKNK